MHEMDFDSNNSAKLFRHIRKAKGQSNEPTTLLNHEGCSHKGDQIPSAWAAYFEALASPSNLEYDEAFQGLITEQYQSLLEEPKGNFLFTVEEVEKSIQILKLNKAAGPDEIDPEHLAYGGHSLTLG